MINITARQLRKAADLQEKVQLLQNELNAILGSGELATAVETGATQKRKFSAATRAKMRASQRARWADKNETPAATPDEREKKKKGKMSAEGLANIRAAQQARWAKQKGTAAATATKPTKKLKRKLSAAGLANIQAGVAKREAAKAMALAAKVS